jgi:hypothetical protein
MRRPRIVIVGGGFAGFHTARKLCRLARGRAEVVVINPTDYFLYLPLLPEVAVGLLHPRDVTVSLPTMLPQVRLILAEVTAVDLEGRRLEYRDAEERTGEISVDSCSPPATWTGCCGRPSPSTPTGRGICGRCNATTRAQFGWRYDNDRPGSAFCNSRRGRGIYRHRGRGAGRAVPTSPAHGYMTQRGSGRRRAAPAGLAAAVEAAAAAVSAQRRGCRRRRPSFTDGCGSLMAPQFARSVMGASAFDPIRS